MAHPEWRKLGQNGNLCIAMQLSRVGQTPLCGVVSELRFRCYKLRGDHQFVSEIR